MREEDMNPYILKAIEDALYVPPGEGGGFVGLADFSPDHASGDVLARGVYRMLYIMGALDDRPKRSNGIA